MIYFNGNVKEIHYSGFTINEVYSCNGELVWSANQPAPTGETKFVASYSDGSTLTVYCDGNTTLDETITKPSGYDYSKMVTAEIGGCITAIGDLAFRNCTNLTSVIIPSGVTSIGDAAFEHCTNLTSAIIPSSLTSIGASAFRNCRSLTSVIIPSGVTSIGGEAFSECASLTAVTIARDAGFNVIEFQTFYGCESLTTIELPENIGTICEEAFYGCGSLSAVTIYTTEPPRPEYSFSDMTEAFLSPTFYVPDGSVNAYKNNRYWRDFASSIKPISERPW